MSIAAGSEIPGMVRPSCSTCLFFEPGVEAPTMTPEKEWGACHRHAPRSARYFPHVLPDDWCGEHDQWWKFYNRLQDQMLRAKQDAQPCQPSGSSEDTSTTASATST
jgi:hypothetical protein